MGNESLNAGQRDVAASSSAQRSREIGAEPEITTANEVALALRFAALPTSGGLTPALLRTLQRAAGNRATGQLVQGYAQRRTAPPPTIGDQTGHASRRSGFIQRQIEYTPGAPNPFSVVNLDTEEADGGHTLARHVSISNTDLLA